MRVEGGSGEGGKLDVSVSALDGEVRVSDEIRAALNGAVTASEITPRNVPAYIAARLAQVAFGDGHQLHIVPGLCCVGDDGQADVMRGEETQLWGADLPAGSCVVLPGTHSKWAWLGDGERVLGFQTHMTGEVYALLTQHGILGRLMVFDGAFVPTALQVKHLVDGFRAHGGFGAVETLETLLRNWHVQDRSVRPVHRMVAHTGFLVFARRLAPGDVVLAP